RGTGGLRGVVSLILLALLAACSPADQGSQLARRPPAGPTATSLPLASGLRTELVVEGLQLPANLALAPDGPLFLTDVPARLRPGRTAIPDRGLGRAGAGGGAGAAPARASVDRRR